MSDYDVYILRCSDDTYYTGMTNDLKKRVERHNAGTGAKYTRSRRPVEIIRNVRVTSKSDALKLERFIKRAKRVEKISLLERFEIERSASQRSNFSFADFMLALTNGKDNQIPEDKTP